MGRISVNKCSQCCTTLNDIERKQIEPNLPDGPQKTKAPTTAATVTPAAIKIFSLSIVVIQKQGYGRAGRRGWAGGVTHTAFSTTTSIGINNNTLHLANVTLRLLFLLVVCVWRVCLFVTTAVLFVFIMLTLKPRKKNLKFFYTIVCLSDVWCLVIGLATSSNYALDICQTVGFSTNDLAAHNTWAGSAAAVIAGITNFIRST